MADAAALQDACLQLLRACMKLPQNMREASQKPHEAPHNLRPITSRTSLPAPEMPSVMGLVTMDAASFATVDRAPAAQKRHTSNYQSIDDQLTALYWATLLL